MSRSAAVSPCLKCDVKNAEAIASRKTAAAAPRTRKRNPAHRMKTSTGIFGELMPPPRTSTHQRNSSIPPPSASASSARAPEGRRKCATASLENHFRMKGESTSTAITLPPHKTLHVAQKPVVSWNEVSIVVPIVAPSAEPTMPAKNSSQKNSFNDASVGSATTNRRTSHAPAPA